MVLWEDAKKPRILGVVGHYVPSLSESKDCFPTLVPTPPSLAPTCPEYPTWISPSAVPSSRILDRVSGKG